MNGPGEPRACSKCGATKPLDEYHVSEGYRRRACRACINKRRRERPRKGRPDDAAAVRAYRETTLGKLAAIKSHHKDRIRHHAERLADVELEIARIKARLRAS